MAIQYKVLCWENKELLHPSRTVSVIGPSPNWECQKSAPVFSKCPKWSQITRVKMAFSSLQEYTVESSFSIRFLLSVKDKWLYKSRGALLPWKLVVIPREIAPEASASQLIESFTCLGQTSEISGAFTWEKAVIWNFLSHLSCYQVGCHISYSIWVFLDFFIFIVTMNHYGWFWPQ